MFQQFYSTKKIFRETMGLLMTSQPFPVIYWSEWVRTAIPFKSSIMASIITHTCTHSLKHTRTHTHKQSLSHTHSFPYTHTHITFLSLSLSLTHTHTNTHKHSLSHTHSFSYTQTHHISFSPSHTHTHTHSLSLSLSLSLSIYLSIYLFLHTHITARNNKRLSEKKAVNISYFLPQKVSSFCHKTLLTN